MSLKNVLATLALGFLLAAAVLACVAAAALPRGKGGEDEIRISGIGNSGNSVGTSGTARAARRAARMKDVPEVSDDTLREVVEAVVVKAKQGDADAAAFVFELAAAQKARPSAPTTQGVAAGPSR